jgi:iron complex outermembrane recepter protein
MVDPRSRFRGWKLVALSALVVPVSLSTRAQEAAPPEEAEEEATEVRDVTITGSRLRTTGMATPTPLTVVTDIELTNMAPRNIIESLSQLPQFFGNTTTNQAGQFAGSPGAGNLNLRGLGVNRTLVLLNGRRVVASARQGSTDINVLPEELVRSIEVVTGGASAAYGTDAVAGVVNFILDTDFTGVTAHAQSGITSRGDNPNYEGSLSFGTKVGEKGHLLLSGEYYSQDGVAGYEERTWHNGWGTVTNPMTGPGQPRVLTAPNVVSTRYTFGGLINQPGSALNRLMFLSDGSYTPFIRSDLSVLTGTATQSVTTHGSGDNIGLDPSVGPVASDATRNNVFAYFDYDVNDNLKLYAQGVIGRSMTDVPSGSAAMFSTWQARIYQDNAFLPEELRQIMIDENLPSFGFSRLASVADVGTQQVITRNKTTTPTFGFEAEAFGWNLDGYYQRGRNEREVIQTGWTRTDRIFMALDAVRDPMTGSIVCRASLFDPVNYGNCVPIDLFGAGRASKEAIAYVTSQDVRPVSVTSELFISPGGENLDTGYDKNITVSYDAGPDKTIWTEMTQQVAEFTADREVWKGFGAGPVLLAVGGAWRKEEIKQIVGELSNPASDPRIVVSPADDPARGIRGIPSGYTSRPTGFQFSTFPNIFGSSDVREAFTETLVPLLSQKPFAEQLNLQLAARWADYSGSGTIWAWKAGADWEITDQVRLRTTLSRDIRAATLSERFDRSGGGANVNDPVFGNTQFIVGTTTGGNPNVLPEEADTTTLGLVYQPSWLNGFAASLDWYDIQIDGAIGQLGPQRVVDDCFAGATQLCARIERDPVTNEILHVDNIFLNINEARVKGADLELRYSRNVSFFEDRAESITFRILGSWLDENSITNLGAPKVDRAGETGSLSMPEYRANASVSYTSGPWSAYVQYRWIGSGKRRAAEVEGIDIDDNTISSAAYTDVNLAYAWTRGDGEVEVFANATNLFDKDPPIAANFSDFPGTGAQTNVNLFDILGRRYVAGVRLRF